VRAAVDSALRLLSRRDRRLLGMSIAIQMATAFLDLLGVLLIGLVGALSVTTIQSQPPPPTVTSVADVMGLDEVSDQNLVLIFAGLAAIVFLMKSVVSSVLTRRVLRFLANRQALVSARLTRALLSQPLTFIQKRSSQETSYALIAGASAATSQILGLLVIAATEAALLIVLSIALLFLSPWIALGSIAFFAVVAFALQRAMGGWAARAATTAAHADIASLNAVQEAVSAYREVTVADRREMYVDRIQALRWQAARVIADTQFIGLFPKYMFEAALVIGGFGLAGALFATQDSVTAVGTLALFLAAGTRVMPSLLRLQGAALGLRGAAGAAGPTFALADELGNPMDSPNPLPDSTLIRERIERGNPDFLPAISLDRVTVTYPDSSLPVLNDVSLEVKPGQSVGLVGRSGAGKSTLADVILGVMAPNEGRALLGGIPPGEALRRWPGGLGYVPQHVVLANDTIRGNVALGLPAAAIDDSLVWEALERAHLAAYLRSAREGLDTLVGEQGVRLSGGQRQRLGIARALYTRPRLLVLDEATSALDAETEQAITVMIDELEGDVTTLIIAHRLSTVRAVDVLVYLDAGRVEQCGSFEELTKSVPDFRRQASLMGIVAGLDPEGP
jgi:ABC-type multidrug transport system fused ATPase/permease subunit